jgi:hypothetical protein
MNQVRFIKLKIDKYVQLYSTKTKVEEDIQTVKTTGIVNIANGGSKYPSNQTATIRQRTRRDFLLFFGASSHPLLFAPTCGRSSVDQRGARRGARGGQVCVCVKLFGLSQDSSVERPLRVLFEYSHLGVDRRGAKNQSCSVFLKIRSSSKYVLVVDQLEHPPPVQRRRGHGPAGLCV